MDIKYDRTQFTNLILGDLILKITSNNLKRIDYDSFVNTREESDFLLDIACDISKGNIGIIDTYGFKTFRRGIMLLVEKKLIRIVIYSKPFYNADMTVIEPIEGINYDEYVKYYKKTVLIDKIKGHC